MKKKSIRLELIKTIFKNIVKNNSYIDISRMDINKEYFQEQLNFKIEVFTILHGDKITYQISFIDDDLKEATFEASISNKKKEPTTIIDKKKDYRRYEDLIFCKIDEIDYRVSTIK